MSSRAGANLRTLDERKELYAAVKELRAKGLSYNAIIAEIRKSKGVRLSKSHLSDWLTGSHEPGGSVTQFEPVPSFELGYVAGTALGDGTTSISSDHNYAIKLQVTDKEFAEEFARCLGAVLNRRPPNVRWYAARRAWRTQLSSLMLQRFLRTPISKIAVTIVRTKDCKVGFLRGFFDAEGTASKYSLSCSNGELAKQSLVVRLLNSLGVETTGPRLNQKRGGTKIIRGRMCRINKDQYVVRVRAESRDLFESAIGFTIRRKKVALAEGRNVRHRKVGKSQD